MFVLRAFEVGGKPIPAAEGQFQHLPIRIGRNPLNDFMLQFAMISNFHACIEDHNGCLCIRDLGSKNGSFLPSPLGGKHIRIQPHTSVALNPDNRGFFISEHIQVMVEVVAQATPVRDALACGAVLGNLSFISPVAAQPAQPPLADASQQQAIPAYANPPQEVHHLNVPPGQRDLWRRRNGTNPSASGEPHAVSPQPSPPNPKAWPVGAQGSGRAPYDPSSPQSPPAGHGMVPPPGRAAVPAAPAVPQAGAPIGAPAPAPVGSPPLENRGSPTGSEPVMSTQALQMDPRTLALIGLRELAGSLIPGRQLETTGDIARFITKLHDAMDVFCRTFMPLRQGYSEFVASLDLHGAPSRRGAHGSPSIAALEQARTPEAIAMALLDPQEHSFDGPSAVEGILADLMIHQVALLDGVMVGVRSLLEELSPEAIDQAVGNGGAAGLLGGKYKARWEEFCQRFEKLTEGQQSFSFVFGQDFAEVYRQYWHRKTSSEDGGLRTVRPPG